MQKILGVIILVMVVVFSIYEVLKLKSWIPTLKLRIVLLYMSFVLLALYLIFN